MNFHNLTAVIAMITIILALMLGLWLSSDKSAMIECLKYHSKGVCVGSLDY